MFNIWLVVNEVTGQETCVAYHVDLKEADRIAYELEQLGETELRVEEV